jgi:hypothetical protein
VIYDSDCRNDHLPGYGGFSSSTTGSLLYRSTLIFNRTESEEGKSVNYRLANLTAGKYSLVAAVPLEDTIMVYKPAKSGYSKEWATTLEKNLGMSCDVEETNEIYYADRIDAEDCYFVVEKDTSTISFLKSEGRTGFPDSKVDYITAANSFLEKNGLMTSEFQNPGVAYNFEESLTKSGDKKTEWRTTVVTYSREIDSLPVWNCQKMVELDSGGNVIGYFQNWRNYEPYKEYELKSPEEAFKEFIAEEDLATKGSPDNVVVTDVLLGYYSQPAASDEKYLQPIYVFEGYSQYGKSSEEFEPVVISAIDEVFNEIP